MKQLHYTVISRLGIVLIFFLLASCGTSRRTLAIEEGWELLSESKVNFVRDKDVIEVKSSSQFVGLQFSVEEKDIRLSDLKITFSNGDKLEPAMDETIAAGQKSRYIDLGRDGRTISNIEFKYRSTGSILSGRASVLVFGKRYDPYNRW